MFNARKAPLTLPTWGENVAEKLPRVTSPHLDDHIRGMWGEAKGRRKGLVDA